MANPFYVEPANPFQALMAGSQAYGEAQRGVGGRKAAEAFKAGDPKGAMAALLEYGDPKALSALAQYQNSANSVYGTPIYGTDPQGNTVVGTFDKQGQFKQINTGNFTPTPGVKTIEGPTGTTIIQGRSGQVLGGGTMQPGQAPQPGAQSPGFIPKDVAGAAKLKEEGEAAGKASAALPNALAQADQSIGIIDTLVKHPGRETATGASGMFDPRNYIPATDARNFQIALKQLEGRAFLQAFESLKGGGAITEIEGQKATQAIARLDRAQSDSEFKKALTDLREILVAGKAKAQLQAQQPQQQPQQMQQPGLPETPRVGDQRQGYRFKGGDPADPSSWVKMR